MRLNLTNAVFIAQSVEQLDQLKHAFFGGGMGEYGQETLISFNYNAIFTYAAKAIQELSDIVKKQQEQIDAQKNRLTD